MDIKGAKYIDEVPYGIYVWETPDGRWVGDAEGHYMNIFSTKGDQEKIKALRDAARAHGIYEGKAVFLSGQRPVTDEEYEEQLLRMQWGLIPDPKDVPAHIEEQKHHGRR